MTCFSSLFFLASISRPTLGSYLNDYQAGGLEQLKVVNFYQPESALMSHKETIEAYFRAHPPATLKQAVSFSILIIIMLFRPQGLLGGKK